ncbi:MAG TPA: hypothetical protein VHB47_09830 [Thermoanaerobaculia bacterium]|nr:hypothetical protein [Thermoanaerobaculia bacterium]
MSQAPARVGGVLTAALVAVLWTQLADKHEAPLTLRLIVWFGCFTLASLLAYSFVISTLIYKEKYSPAANQVAERLIIGGFLLTAPARAEKKERNLTVQEIFDRGAYNKDRIWNPASRALSKLLFILLYLGLTVCGTALLTCASILLLYPR